MAVGAVRRRSLAIPFQRANSVPHLVGREPAVLLGELESTGHVLWLAKQVDDIVDARHFGVIGEQGEAQVRRRKPCGKRAEVSGCGTAQNGARGR